MSSKRLSCAALVLSLAIAGCATVTTIPATPGQKNAMGEEVIETVHVENTDWRLLCVLPIASGDVEEPNTVSCSWFRDTVSVTNQVRMIRDEMKRVGATRVTDIVTYENDEDVFLLAFLRRKMHTSAVLSKGNR